MQKRRNISHHPDKTLNEISAGIMNEFRIKEIF